MGTKPVKPVQQIEMFPTVLHLKRFEPEHNMKRFYLMTVQRDLFGGARLVREWGRIGSSGTIASNLYPDEGQAVDALAKIAKEKAARGYE
jgi:predicted DNA-binding WGR domain protein